MRKFEITNWRKVMFGFFVTSFFGMLFLLPIFSVLAQTTAPSTADTQTFKEQGFIPCGRDVGGGADGKPNGKIDDTEKCEFIDFVEVIRRLITYGIIVAGSLAAIAFFYAGFLFMTASGSAEQYGKAKGIFAKVVWGFIIMLTAWLIVKTLESALVAGNVPSFLRSGTP